MVDIAFQKRMVAAAEVRLNEVEPQLEFITEEFFNLFNV
jgi:hypothetical protein